LDPIKKNGVIDMNKMNEIKNGEGKYISDVIGLSTTAFMRQIIAADAARKRSS